MFLNTVLINVNMMQKIENCPICNTKFEEKPYIVSKDYLVSKQEFNIVKCPQCTLMVTNPKPEFSEMPKYYDSKDYISHTNSRKTLFDKMYQKVKKKMLRKKMRLIKSHFQSIKNIYVLDYGCGSGDFLEKAKENQFFVLGFEPNIYARKKALEKDITVIGEQTLLGRIPDSFLDVVTFWHSIEHVHDLSVLNNVIALLKPKGKIFLAIPEHLSFDAKVYKKYWAAYDVPRHLFHFNENSLSLLMSNLGCKLIQKKALTYDSYYASMLSEKNRGRSKVFVLFNGFIIGVLSNIFARISKKSFSSQIYVFEKE